MNNVNGTAGSKDSFLCLSADLFFTMNYITKGIVGFLAAVPLIASASETHYLPTPQQALQAKIEEVARLALTCGQKKERINYNSPPHRVADYILTVTPNRFPSLVFNDGTYRIGPNGKVDATDGIEISYGFSGFGCIEISECARWIYELDQRNSTEKAAEVKEALDDLLDRTNCLRS